MADGDFGAFTFASGVASLDDDVVVPDDVLSTGKNDEYCLTYEATGDTWEWFNCAALGDGTFLGLSDVGISSYTDGAVLFTSGSDVIDDAAAFYYDDANNRLAIGAGTFSGVPTDTDLAIIATSSSQKARLTVINTNGADVEGIFDARNDGTDSIQFGSVSSHPIVIFAGNSSRATFGASGGLRLAGIGGSLTSAINDPDAEIDLEGDGTNIRFDATGTTRTGLEFYESGSARMVLQYNPSNDTFAIRDEENAADRITVTQDGLTSIGTTTSNASLSIQSTSTTDILNLFETDGTEVLTVLESGNVGIGTSTPGGALWISQIADTDGAFALYASRTISGTNSIAEYYNTGTLRSRIRANGIQDWFLNNGSGEAGSISYTTPSGDPGIQITAVDTDDRAQIILDGTTLTFGASTNGGTPQQLYITDAGNVGIGDATPDAHLEVSADGTTGGNIFLLSSNDDNDGDLLTVTDEGNVGIGTTSPASTLDVWGDLRVGTSGTPTLLVDASTDQVLLSDGSSAAPSLSFANDSDTGFYAGGNAINIGVSGTAAFSIYSNRFQGTGVDGSPLILRFFRYRGQSYLFIQNLD